MTVVHATAEELLAGLGAVQASPAERGLLELIVRRPAEGEREVLEAGELSLEDGLVGDRWALGSRTADAQLTLMSSRVAQLVAGARERWALAGDQLYVDLDLSVENLPAGTRLAIGETVVEVTALPHTGCAKFRARFGSEALKLVNKSPGRELRLRGLNARVVEPGVVRAGDSVVKLPA